MNFSSSLQGQHVVVVGGTSGIGRAVVRAAQTAGAKVTALGRGSGIACDVTDPDSVNQAFARLGPVDHLVITAGARVGSPSLAQLTDAELALTYEVKLFGALRAIRFALPKLAPQASVTLTSGLLSRKPSAGGLLKGSVNAAIEAAARQLAKELAPRRVNVVSPGVVDTELWSGSTREATLARIGAGLPVGRVGLPHELAQAYVLAMANGFMTGAVIDVDGGGLL
ncbi:SDR family oxidoreductase [Rhodoferax sp. GW822-FHT02A01]|uniref:SDR family oxidoreductase n=1 Tax=Rhodoferax sp. GW822-FHT02A01 TaxID=3141537 RepID=UPI00315DC70E